MSAYLEKRKKMNKFWLTWSVIEAIVILAAGVLAIIAGVREDITGNIDNILGYAISGFVVLDGIFRIVMFFAKYDRGDESTPLIIAGFEVAIGALLIFLQYKHAGLLIESLVAFISIAMMTMGALLLTYAIFSIARRHEKLVMPIAVIVLAAILIGVGVAVIILQNTGNTHNKITMIMTGSVLGIIGLSLFVMGIFASKKDKKEIEKFEQEESGDYDIAGEPRRKKGKKGPNEEEVVAKQAEVIEDVEVLSPEPTYNNKGERVDQLGGPRAIESKDNNQD